MKKIIFILAILLTSLNSYAQTESNQSVQAQNKKDIPATYELFPTQNIWIFIKLNTSNGQMWLVQFDVDNENRFESYLRVLPLVDEEKEIDGRFTLYSTQNMWTFLLLDKIDGRTWQVQWSLDTENRFVLPIH